MLIIIVEIHIYTIFVIFLRSIKYKYRVKTDETRNNKIFKGEYLLQFLRYLSIYEFVRAPFPLPKLRKNLILNQWMNMTCLFKIILDKVKIITIFIVKIMKKEEHNHIISLQKYIKTRNVMFIVRTLPLMINKISYFMT